MVKRLWCVVKMLVMVVNSVRVFKVLYNDFVELMKNVLCDDDFLSSYGLVSILYCISRFYRIK